MSKIVTNKNDRSIGVYTFPDRKKPCLCVRKGNEITVYGTFTNEEVAEDFMNEVAEFFGITRKVTGENPNG